MTQYHFSMVLEPDREEPERYNVRVPALDGCFTYGESIPTEMHPTIATTVIVTAEVAASGSVASGH